LVPGPGASHESQKKVVVNSFKPRPPGVGYWAAGGIAPRVSLSAMKNPLRQRRVGGKGSSDSDDAAKAA